MPQRLFLCDATQTRQPYSLQQPGVLVGTHSLADIPLKATAEAIAPFQLAVRINDLGVEVINLSLQAAVLLQGQAVPLRQPVRWSQNDTLSIGSYTLHWETQAHEQSLPMTPVLLEESTASLASASVMAQPFKKAENDEALADNRGSVLVETEPNVPPENPFADLLSGPSTLPVGADPTSTLHPFSMHDSINRNPADPLEQLGAKGLPDKHGDQLLSLLK